MIKVAILVAQDVQYEEFAYPYEQLKKLRSHMTLDVILAPKKKYPEPTAKNGTKLFWNYTAQEIVASGQLKYDLIVIPGGFAPEVMRLDPELLAIVRYNIDKDSLIAAICHGTQVLISAGNVPKDVPLTGYIGTKHDIQAAGYKYSDYEIDIGRNILTCSHYKYNPQFIYDIIRRLEKIHDVDLISSLTFEGLTYNISSLSGPKGAYLEHYNKEYGHNQL